MAKQSLTAPSYATNNVSNLPIVVKNQAVPYQATLDKASVDIKAYETNLIAELNGNVGSYKIGHQSTNVTSNNVGDALEEIITAINDVTLGDIPNGSITDLKLNSDIKVGSLSSLNTTEKSSVVSSINEVVGSVLDVVSDVSTINGELSTLETDLNIVRTAKLATGLVNTMAIDTDGTFDLTKNGNILTIIPNLTTTNATVTVAVDGQTAKLIKKANDIGNFIALDIGDLKKNTPTQLVWDSVSDFFIFAPKGGSNIKSIQRFAVSIGIGVGTVNRSIAQVDLSKSVIRNVGVNPSALNSTAQSLVKLSFTSNQNVELKRLSTSTYSAIVYFDVIEFNNVKSIQTLNFLFSATTTNKAITAINTSKSEVFHTFTSTVGISSAMIMASRITTSTNVEFLHASSDEVDVCAFVIEFN